MPRLFDRNIAVTFGIWEDPQPIKITDLRVTFDVKHTGDSGANTGKISIYNLNPYSRAMLKLSSNEKIEKGLFLRLEVGYGDDLGTIFIGDIKKSVSVRKGPDIITTIEVADSAKALEEAFIDQSFSSDSDLQRIKYKTIVKAVVETFQGYPGIENNLWDRIKDYVVEPSVATGGATGGVYIQNGRVLTGASRVLLAELLKDMGKRFTFQDGKLVIDDILPEQEEIPYSYNHRYGKVYAYTGKTRETVVILPPAPAPELREDGIEFKTLIQSTKIRPGVMVEITSEGFDKELFVVQNCHHIGDTHDNSWYVICEATPADLHQWERTELIEAALAA